MEFVEVRLDVPVQSVKEMLFGTAGEARRAEIDGVAPGEAGRSSPSLLYLSGFEGLNASLFSLLHKLVTRGVYVDTLGNSWPLSEDLWIVGAITFPAPSQTLHPNHWLPNAFHRRIQVDPPSTEDDLLQICRSMVASIRQDVVVDLTMLPFLRGAGAADDNLHALRRWIQSATPQIGPMGRLTPTDLRDAMTRDMRWILSQIPYRGQVLLPEEFDRWLQQFPAELSAVGVHLVRKIAEDYYIGQGHFHEALDDLIRRSGIPQNTEVVFCRWQMMGESATRMAHVIKNQAGWRVRTELDMNQPPGTWPALSRHEARWFVLADDFIGSGRTISSLFAPPHHKIPSLLARYPGSQLRILVVAGFEMGVRRLKEATVAYRNRVQVVVSRLWQDHDRCFHPSSRILWDPIQRDRLRAFCIDAGEMHMPNLTRELRLGFEETGGIVVFYDFVPNNTLPILWYSRGSWQPLFPRSGLP